MPTMLGEVILEKKNVKSFAIFAKIFFVGKYLLQCSCDRTFEKAKEMLMLSNLCERNLGPSASIAKAMRCLRLDFEFMTRNVKP